LFGLLGRGGAAAADGAVHMWERGVGRPARQEFPEARPPRVMASFRWDFWRLRPAWPDDTSLADGDRGFRAPETPRACLQIRGRPDIPGVGRVGVGRD